MSKYNCDKCDYHTNYESKYKIHLTTLKHTGGERKKRDKKDIQTYNCDKCYYKTSNKNVFDNHLLVKHSDIDVKKTKLKYYCEYCDIGSMHKSVYNKHILTDNHKKMIEFKKK